MSSVPPPDAQHLIRRVGAADRAQALSVLLSGRVRSKDPAVAQFLAFAAEHGLSLEHLWVLDDEAARRPAAATLIVTGVGRTATVFLSPVHHGRQIPDVGRLIAHAADQADPSGGMLMQALLESSHDKRLAALEAGGFIFLAELLYMQRSVKPSNDPPPAVKCDGRVLDPLCWEEAHRERFARVVSASYEDTLDCPGLLGRRSIGDILAGHRATGRFNPRLWRAWFDGDEPVAVLLLAGSTHAAGHELVYLGVAKPYRGRGLGRVLVKQALALSGREQPGRLFLAVDKRNSPAVKLYEELGFRRTTRKSAMIRR